MTRTAIVTTFRGGHGMVDAFARYHLAMGFDWIFLFHDEPGAPRPTVAAGASGLVVNARDEDLYRRWRDTPLYRTRPDYVEAFLEREVMIRQILNAEVAIELSLERGIDWLLHIDIDELFYSPDKSVSEHFDSLTEAGYSGMRYLNYEGAPERGDLTSGFHDVTLFKKSPRMCAGGSRATSVTTVPCLQSFRARSRQLFHYYANGKSAARVTHGLTTHGVHGFRAQPCGETSTPAILHYPCCTFDVFWEKYQMR